MISKLWILPDDFDLFSEFLCDDDAGFDLGCKLLLGLPAELSFWALGACSLDSASVPPLSASTTSRMAALIAQHGPKACHRLPFLPQDHSEPLPLFPPLISSSGSRFRPLQQTLGPQSGTHECTLTATLLNRLLSSCSAALSLDPGEDPLSWVAKLAPHNHQVPSSSMLASSLINPIIARDLSLEEDPCTFLPTEIPPNSYQRSEGALTSQTLLREVTIALGCSHGSTNNPGISFSSHQLNYLDWSLLGDDATISPSLIGKMDPLTMITPQFLGNGKKPAKSPAGLRAFLDNEFLRPLTPELQLGSWEVFGLRFDSSGPWPNYSSPAMPSVTTFVSFNQHIMAERVQMLELRKWSSTTVSDGMGGSAHNAVQDKVPSLPFRKRGQCQISTGGKAEVESMLEGSSGQHDKSLLNTVYHHATIPACPSGIPSILIQGSTIVDPCPPTCIPSSATNDIAPVDHPPVMAPLTRLVLSAPKKARSATEAYLTSADPVGDQGGAIYTVEKAEIITQLPSSGQPGQIIPGQLSETEVNHKGLVVDDQRLQIIQVPLPHCHLNILASLFELDLNLKARIQVLDDLSTRGRGCRWHSEVLDSRMMGKESLTRYCFRKHCADYKTASYPYFIS